MSEQEKRERIIREFERFVQEYSASCTDYNEEVLAGILAILKEQKPRVMTLEEVKRLGDSDAMYLQTIVSPNEVCTAIYQPDKSGDDYIRIVSTWKKTGFYVPQDYNRSWRCWTSRPTDEQREATPWAKPSIDH